MFSLPFRFFIQDYVYVYDGTSDTDTQVGQFDGALPARLHCLCSLLQCIHLTLLCSTPPQVRRPRLTSRQQDRTCS